MSSIGATEVGVSKQAQPVSPAREQYLLGRTKNTKGESFAAAHGAEKAKNAEYGFFSVVGFGRRFTEAGATWILSKRVAKVARENNLSIVTVGLAEAVRGGKNLDKAIAEARNQGTAEERQIRALAESGVPTEQKYASLSGQEGTTDTPLGQRIKGLVDRQQQSITDKFASRTLNTTEISEELLRLANDPNYASEKGAEVLRNVSRGELRQIARDLHELAVNVARGNASLDNIDLALTNMVSGDKTLENLANTQGLYAAAKYMRLGTAGAVLLAGGLGLALTNPFTLIPAAGALAVTFGISWWAKHRENVIRRQIYQRDIARQPNAVAEVKQARERKKTKKEKAAAGIGHIFGSMDVENDKFNYTRVSANTLLHGEGDTKGVDTFIATANEMQAGDVVAALDLMAAIDKRIDLSLSQNVQMIDYGSGTRNEFIGEWVAKRGELKAAIDSARQRLGLSQQTFESAYDEATTRANDVLLADQQAKDRAFLAGNLVSSTHNALAVSAMSFAVGGSIHMELMHQSFGEYMFAQHGVGVTSADTAHGATGGSGNVATTQAMNADAHAANGITSTNTVDMHSSGVINPNDISRVSAMQELHGGTQISPDQWKTIQQALSDNPHGGGGVDSLKAAIDEAYKNGQGGPGGVSENALRHILEELSHGHNPPTGDELAKELQQAASHGGGDVKGLTPDQIMKLLHDHHVVPTMHNEAAQAGARFVNEQHTSTDVLGKVPATDTSSTQNIPPAGVPQIPTAGAPQIPTDTNQSGFDEVMHGVQKSWSEFAQNPGKTITDDFRSVFHLSPDANHAGVVGVGHNENVNVIDQFHHHTGTLETHANAGNMYGHDHFSIPTNHPEDASDRLLGTWQGAHTAYDPNGKWVEFYGTYPHAQMEVNIDGHYYTFQPGTMTLGSHDMLTLHPLDGGHDITMSQDNFLHMVGYGDQKSILAGYIINHDTQVWGQQHGWTLTHNASDRIAQYLNGQLGARHAGLDAMIQRDLTAHGISNGDIHYTAVPMGEALQNGHHITILAQNQYIDSAAFRGNVVEYIPGADSASDGAYQWLMYGAGIASTVAAIVGFGAGRSHNRATRFPFITQGPHPVLSDAYLGGTAALAAASFFVPPLALISGPALAGYIAGRISARHTAAPATAPAAAHGTGGGHSTGTPTVATPTVTPPGGPTNPRTPGAPTPRPANAYPNFAGSPLAQAAHNLGNPALGTTGRPYTQAVNNMANQLMPNNPGIDHPVMEQQVRDAAQAARDAYNANHTLLPGNRVSVHMEDAAAALVEGNPLTGLDLTNEMNARAMAEVMLPNFSESNLNYTADAIRRAAIARQEFEAIPPVQRNNRADLQAAATRALDRINAEVDNTLDPAARARGIAMQAIATRNMFMHRGHPGSWTLVEGALNSAFASQAGMTPELNAVAAAAVHPSHMEYTHAQFSALPYEDIHAPMDQRRIYEMRARAAIQAARLRFGATPSPRDRINNVLRTLNDTYQDIPYLGVSEDQRLRAMDEAIRARGGTFEQRIQAAVAMSPDEISRATRSAELITLGNNQEMFAVARVLNNEGLGGDTIRQAIEDSLANRGFHINPVGSATIEALLDPSPTTDEKMAAGIRYLIADARFTAFTPAARARAVSDAVDYMRTAFETPGAPITFDQIQALFRTPELNSLSPAERASTVVAFYNACIARGQRPAESARYALSGSGLPDYASTAYNDAQIETYYNAVAALDPAAIPSTAGLDIAEIAINEFGLNVAARSAIATRNLATHLTTPIAWGAALQDSLRGVTTDATSAQDLATIVQGMASGVAGEANWIASAGARTAAALNATCTGVGFGPDARTERAVVLGSFSTSTIPDIVTEFAITPAVAGANPNHVAQVARGLLLSRPGDANDIRSAFRNNAVVADRNRVDVARAAYDMLSGTDPVVALDVALVASGVRPGRAIQIANMLRTRGAHNDNIRSAMQRVDFTPANRRTIAAGVIRGAGIVAGTGRKAIRRALEDALAASGCPDRLGGTDRGDLVNAIYTAVGVGRGTYTKLDDELNDMANSLR